MNYTKREPGFYWVFWERWIVLEYHSDVDKWYSFLGKNSFDDSDFKHINENRIVNPNDT